MHAQNFIVDQSTDRQAVETLGEGLPQLNTVPSSTLLVETVDSIDGARLVVPSQQEEVFRVLDFVAKQ